MQNLVLILHVIICVLLIVLVLLQSGREGMGVIFGGGGSSFFGSSGAGGILVKLTAYLAVIFIVTSLTYNVLTSTKTSKESSVINVNIEEVPSKPTIPATDAATQSLVNNSTQSSSTQLVPEDVKVEKSETVEPEKDKETKN